MKQSAGDRRKMNYETARTYARRIAPETLDTRVKVTVPVNTGTHHTIIIFGRTPNGGEYEESWRESCPSQVRDLEIDVKLGSIVYQRTISPASGETLERYGVVNSDRHVDWGSDADWVTDFGPVGDVTRQGLRSPSSHSRAKRERILAPTGEEAVGGAVEEAGHTSGGGSG
jgi:hypothetical protein